VKNNLDLFQSELEKIQITLNEQQIEQFVMYYEMMVETNQVMNLTSITEPVDVIHKHYVDSLVINQIYSFAEKKKIIDIGTGAGFPGIPLKIAFPQLEIVLLDSLNKRIKFLNSVIDSLGLTGISCIHGRSEDIARMSEYREQFDLCVSRAVANLSSLSELCIPFVKVGGKFISYKAGNSEEEISSANGAIEKLGGKLGQVSTFEIPDTRVFVEIDKIKGTSKKYPRKAGTPVKEPLK
jgi:16S rRNA (guanine527-N7)-methyltransferase